MVPGPSVGGGGGGVSAAKTRAKVTGGAGVRAIDRILADSHQAAQNIDAAQKTEIRENTSGLFHIGHLPLGESAANYILHQGWAQRAGSFWNTTDGGAEMEY